MPAAGTSCHGSSIDPGLTNPLSSRRPDRITDLMGGISNRMKEIKRRRHRKQKVAKFALKLKKATQSERLVIANKLRKMTAGAEVLIARMGLDERKRG